MTGLYKPMTLLGILTQASVILLAPDDRFGLL